MNTKVIVLVTAAVLLGGIAFWMNRPSSVVTADKDKPADEHWICAKCGTDLAVSEEQFQQWVDQGRVQTNTRTKPPQAFAMCDKCGVTSMVRTIHCDTHNINYQAYDLKGTVLNCPKCSGK